MRLPTFTVERLFQALTLAVLLFLAVYLLTYAQNGRQRVDCQNEVNRATITSLQASRDAGRIERDAMRELVSGLLAASDRGVTRGLLEGYQQRLSEADTIRTDNPLPDPDCP